MKNPITSTLFRFVNYRSAQLATAEDQSIKFVNQPISIAEGIFYDAVRNRPAGSTKMAALLEASETFTDDFVDTKAVEAISNTLFSFSSWIARNKSDYAPAELRAEVAKVTAALTEVQRSKIWNNFFYQVITQKSFYVKEALMQMLVADHVFRLLDKVAEGYSEYNDNLMTASVTLPVELFEEAVDQQAEPIDTGLKPVVANAYFNLKLQ